MRFIILLTKECNLKCKHCFLGEAKRLTFADESLEYVLNELDNAGCEYISVTGGEPFLHIDLLEKVVIFAGERRMRCSINTSAYWGKSKRIRRKLREFKAAGLTMLKLSTDSYHQEFVSLDTFDLAIDLALDLKLKVEVTICELEPLDQIRSLAFLRDKYGTSIDIRFQKVGDYGLAKENLNVPSTIQVPVDQWSCNAPDSPAILPNGDVYVCCGPPLSEEIFPHGENPYILGNIFDEHLIDLVNKSRTSEWVQAIRSADAHCPLKTEVFSTSQASTLCDLCMEYSLKMRRSGENPRYHPTSL